MSDLIIIGAGPAGYVAAIRAAQLGKAVTLIEKDSLGGTCLNRGCIPTKSYYKSAEVINSIKNANEFGINCILENVNFETIYERKNRIVDELGRGIDQILSSYGVNLVYGAAEFVGDKTVLVHTKDGELSLEAMNIIIATGSLPIIPNIDGVGHQKVITSDQLINLPSLPSSLLVVGAGVIGLEFAMIYASLGVNVEVITQGDKFLFEVDEEIVKRYPPIFKKKNIKFSKDRNVYKIEDDLGKPRVLATDSKGNEYTYTADFVLMAVGRKPNLSDLHLEKTIIDFDKSGIRVDENYETSVKGVFAVGDVNGKHLLAHAASHQAISVVEYLFDEKLVNHSPVPYAIFVFPEIAGVGLTEEQAKERGAFKKSKFPFAAIGKAKAMGEVEGFVKFITDENETILGVHMFGPNASSLIAEATLAISNRLNIQSFIDTIHAHPTLPEAIHEAALGIKGISIHQIKTN